MSILVTHTVNLILFLAILDECLKHKMNFHVGNKYVHLQLTNAVMISMYTYHHAGFQWMVTLRTASVSVSHIITSILYNWQPGNW